jgi:hypothetical protein
MGKIREAIRHRLETDKCSKRSDANACDLGKGEVSSSILTGSTRFYREIKELCPGIRP